jgi:hypothetical protein
VILVVTKQLHVLFVRRAYRTVNLSYSACRLTTELEGFNHEEEKENAANKQCSHLKAPS